jgi:hypothetical protein
MHNAQDDTASKAAVLACCPYYVGWCMQATAPERASCPISYQIMMYVPRTIKSICQNIQLFTGGYHIPHKDRIGGMQIDAGIALEDRGNSSVKEKSTSSRKKQPLTTD